MSSERVLNRKKWAAALAGVMCFAASSSSAQQAADSGPASDDDARSVEQVQEVHYLAGGDCLMAKVKTSGNAELESILRKQIATLDAVASTQTFIALSTYKESAKIQLPDQP